MSRLHAFGLVGALVLIAAGCAKMPPTHYYVLEQRGRAAAEVPASHPGGWTIGIRAFEVDAPYDQDHIVYRVGEDSPEIGFYAYHVWAAPLSRMLPAIVADAMHGMAGVGSIEPVMAGREYAAYLEGRLLRLEEVDRSEGQLIQVQLTLRLTSRDGTELWSETLESEGSTQTSEVGAVVERMRAVVAEVLQRARAGLASALNGDRIRNLKE